MRVVSLFSGIGLLDLGLEWAGMRTVQFCELDPYCRGILERRYPGVPIHDDVHTLDPVACDVVAGGVPCQPASVAGKRKGTDDDRWLWPAFRRILVLARPRYVIVENVPGLLTVNGGDAFGEVLGDLADLGFDAEWAVFGARDVGAPHRRNRVWIVADTNRERRDGGAGFVGAGRRGQPADGGGSWWSVEPDVGRVAHRVPARVDRLRALGNAVVPQCAQVVGRRVMELSREAG